MAKYDKDSLSQDIERRKQEIPTLTNAQLKKELAHVRTLLDKSLPTCLRRRTETILNSTAPATIHTEVTRFDYEAHWYQLMRDYEKLVSKEVKKRRLAA
ncbi:MAG: hypothetical protein Kow0099_25570 [Candidatus Abyssubacteria bacterium]